MEDFDEVQYMIDNDDPYEFDTYNQYTSEEEEEQEARELTPAEEFEQLKSVTAKAIDEYILNHNLSLVYNSLHLEANKYELLDWLDEAFTRHKITYFIDCSGEALLLRQLLTHPTCTTERMMNANTRHSWITQMYDWPTDKKRYLRLSCEELAIGSSELALYHKRDANLFTYIHEYTDLLAKHGRNSLVPVDVCYVWYEDTIVALSVLEKYDFKDMDNLIVEKRLLSTNAKERDKDNKIKYTATLNSEKVPGEITSLVKTSLESLYTLLAYKPVGTSSSASNTTNNVIREFFCRRVENMTDCSGGVIASMDSVKRCIDRLATYTNAVIDKSNGPNSFHGPIELGIDEIARSTFNKGNKAKWNNPIKLMMMHPIERAFVKDHRRQEIDINTLIIRFGGEEIARTIIPSTTYPHHQYLINNGTIINNININVTTGKKKRKRVMTEPEDEDEEREAIYLTDSNNTTLSHHDRVKRIRLIKEVEKDDTLTIFRLSSKKLDVLPEQTEEQRCTVCHFTKKMTSFLKRQPNGSFFIHNICYTCLSAHADWKKSCKETQ